MKKDQRRIAGGASGVRQDDDFYPTPEYVTRALLDNHKFEGDIWECACGDGRMSEVLKAAGYTVASTDLIDRGYYDRIPHPIDFLLENTHVDNIVTNPPFNLSYEFILQGLSLADKCLALFLPIRYLTGKSRAEIYKENPPGSGTTAVACHNLNRRFICIEKDRDYWAASVKRLEDAQKQLSIFDYLERAAE